MADHGDDHGVARERRGVEGEAAAERGQLQAGVLREALKQEICHQTLVGPCGPAGSSPKAVLHVCTDL